MTTGALVDVTSYYELLSRSAQDQDSWMGHKEEALEREGSCGTTQP